MTQLFELLWKYYMLALIIIVLGHFLGRLEGWSEFDALYQAFVTATTLGYGDFHPSKKASKALEISKALANNSGLNMPDSSSNSSQ